MVREKIVVGVIKWLNKTKKYNWNASRVKWVTWGRSQSCVRYQI